MRTIATPNNSDKPPAPTARPVPLPVIPEAIPEALRTLPQWVVWLYEWRLVRKAKKGKKAQWDWTKVPHNARTSTCADSTDPATWSSFDEAHAAYQRGGWDGVGFVPLANDNLVVIDLDKCRDPATGAVEDWAARIVAEVDTYTEASPSGKGLRLVAYGCKPDRQRSKRGKVEIYDGLTKAGKAGGRYLTFTGQRLPGTPAEIGERQAAITLVYERELKTPPTRTKKASATDTAAAFTSAIDHPSIDPPAPGPPTPLGTDAELIARAKAARNGEKFGRLWAGDWDGYDSPSEADLALCNILLYWTRGDLERVERLFGQSELGKRAKWTEREDYRRLTLDEALRGASWQSNGQGHPSAPPPAPFSVEVQGLRLTLASRKTTDSGKVVVQVVVTREGQRIDCLTVTSADSNRDRAAARLAQHASVPPSFEFEAAIGKLLAADSPAPATTQAAAAPTVFEVVSARVPEALGIACRTDRGLWSEQQGGEVTRSGFITFVPPWLIDAATVAADAPRDDFGVVKRDRLIGCIKRELEVLWADLTSRLPTLAAAAQLGEKTQAGQQFRQALIRLWTATRTFEVAKTVTGTSGEAVAARASLISRVRSQAEPYLKHQKAPEVRQQWRPVQQAFHCWWRLWIAPDGAVSVRLAMRWPLVGQIGVELPGVRNQATLNAVGVRSGCIDPDPPVTQVLSGGVHRLSVLCVSVTEELMDQPPDEEEANQDSDPVTPPECHCVTEEARDGSNSPQ
jgi:hypothetical protein